MQFQCPDGSYALTQVNGYDVPGCASGSGTWVPDPVPFWQQELPADQVGALLAAIMMLWAVAWLGRKVEDWGIGPFW